MDEILNYCELNMYIYDLQKVPDEIIKDIIKDYSKDVAIFSVLFKCNVQLNPNINLHDYDYFINLVNDIARVSGFDYSEDELKVYRMLAVSFYHNNIKKEDTLLKFISNCEEIDSLKVNGIGVLYAQERVRYRLLRAYSNEFVKYYDKMKDLLVRLKANKDEYEELDNTIHKLLNKEEQ
nr:MAG TPA: hypothetical protein [Caudoviricetes sp.]